MKIELFYQDLKYILLFIYFYRYKDLFIFTPIDHQSITIPLGITYL